MDQTVQNLERLRELLPVVVGAAGASLVALLVLLALIKRFLHVAPPNLVLIFSGRNRVAADGRKVGFRVVFGGRAFRMPIVEQVQAMDLTTIAVPMSVSGAYSEGAEGALGIPLALQAIANVKVSSDPRFIGNAIERFLGRDRAEIARVAKETLEGHLRGVVAKMTPEEVNEDRLKFAKSLIEEAEKDLEKLGLHLDTLKITHVADERSYLDSIGRKRIAEVVMAAEVAESNAQRAAQEAEAAAKARGEVAQTNAKANVLRKENELRQIKADLDATARSEEERATASAQQARAQAEQELQRIRGELETLRLAADVTIPAEAARRVQELEAGGKAATIAQRGRAQAEALEAIAHAWRSTQGQAMDMFVLQNLEEIFGKVTQAAGNIQIREVSLIDGGDGAALPAYVSGFPAAVGHLLHQIDRTLGIDVSAVLTGRTAAPAAPANGGVR
jgi:flotillin